MTDFDLDRLGDVWRQQPDQAEMERLQRSAAAVSRRARIGRVVDVCVAVAVAVVVLVLVLSNPKRETLVMGGAAIIFLLASNVRQRRLREVELKGLTGGTEDMLDQSISRLETALKHHRLTMIAAGPTLIFGILFAATADRSGIGSLIPALRNVHLSKALWSGIIIAGLAIAALVIGAAMRRNKRELEKLRTMREAYRQEHESSTP